MEHAYLTAVVINYHLADYWGNVLVWGDLPLYLCSGVRISARLDRALLMHRKPPHPPFEQMEPATAMLEHVNINAEGVLETISHVPLSSKKPHLCNYHVRELFFISSAELLTEQCLFMGNCFDMLWLHEKGLMLWFHSTKRESISVWTAGWLRARGLTVTATIMRAVKRVK